MLHAVQFGDASEDQQKQVRGLGTDVAIVSSMVFLAQFCVSVFIGPLVHVSGSTAVVMISAAVLSFVGAVSASAVTYVGL